MTVLRIEAGAHTFTIEQPVGWTHLNQGSQQRFRQDSRQIVITDAGAVTQSGYLRQLSDVMDLVQRDQPETASATLHQIRIERKQFPSDAGFREFLEAKRETEQALRNPYGAERAALEVSMNRLERSLHVAGRKRLEELVPDQLRPFGFNEMRAVAHREYRTLNGHPLLIVDTWDRLSHQHPRRYALVLNEGSLLVLYNERGYDSAGAEQVTALVDSMRFSETPQSKEVTQRSARRM